MIGFRLSAQKPPEARRVTDGVIQRFDHVFEVDPAKMTVFEQQEMPAWDTLRIVDSRWEHLAWMHDHWADGVLLAADLDLGGLHPDDEPAKEEHPPSG
jgi:hypothetical protein